MFSKKKKKNKNKKVQLLPRLIVGIFMAIAVAQTVGTIGAFNAPEIASAQQTIPFQPQVPIQGTENIKFGDSTRPIAEYIKAMYAYAVGAVGILATIMLMIGGLRWILAAGNPSSISEAKDMIIASISGMVLVLTSYLILNEVNPALTDLSKNISKIQQIQGKVDPTAKIKNCAWESAKPVATGVGNSSGQQGETGCDNGKLTGSESDCTNEKKAGETNCCCSYEKTTGCEWSNTTCSEGKTSYTYDIFTTRDENAVKNCGSKKEGGDSFCCCEPKSCPTCVSLKDTGMCSPQASICETKESFSIILKDAFNNRGGLNWFITSGIRKADQMENGEKSNHLTGEAVDISIERISDLTTAQSLYTSLSEYIPPKNIHLECSTEGCCANYPETNCRVVGYATGLHFHVDAPSGGASRSF